jgi:hypothetical protein
MANHEEINLDNPRIEKNENGEPVLKGAQIEKLVTWVNKQERQKKGPEFNRKIVLSQDFDGLPLKEVLHALHRKYTIDARGKFRGQMDAPEAQGFVESLHDDNVPEYGDCKRAEWKVALGVSNLFERPKTAAELAAEIESGDHSAEELDKLIAKLQKIRDES